MNKFYLIFFFLFNLTCLLAQSPLNQRVSIAGESISIEAALYQLIDKEDVKLTFNNAILPKKTVDLAFENVPLSIVLKEILRGTNLNFEVLGRQILLYEQEIKVKEFTVSGFFEDASTGERLIGANVYDRISQRGVQANEYGFYSLTLPAQNVKLVFSSFAYKAQEESFKLKSNVRINRSLESSLTLQEVIVYAGDSTDLPNDLSINVLDIENVKNLPSLGGEQDILRVTHLLPGVQTGTDGVGGIYVRGGNSGQNLMLIDGVPVYYVSHAVGLLSVFNTQTIRTAKLVKGGFPARYGGRISSVLDIRTKEGNMKEVKAWGNLGLLTAGGGVEGPILKNKSSFLLSGRISYLDVYLLPYSKKLKKELGEEGSTAYDFFDLNAKINYAFSDRDKIYFSFYKGSDQFEDEGLETSKLTINDNGMPITYSYRLTYEQNLDWNNKVAALRWNHLFSDKLFANTSVTYSKLEAGFEFTTLDSLFENDDTQALFQSYTNGRYTSGIEDIGVELNLDLVPSSTQYIRFGLSVHNQKFMPGVFITTTFTGGQQNNGVVPISTTEYAAYFENEVELGDFSFNAGIRANVHSVKKRNYRILEPRFSFKWKLLPKLQFKGAYSKMTQFLHLLSTSGIGLPTDLWVPSTNKIAPQKSAQFVLGFDYEPNKIFHFAIETYYKKMNDLLSFSEGASFENDWQKNVTQGKGNSYGFEFLFSKKRGKTTGWVAYTRSFATRQFERINFGEEYPFKYDRRNDFKIAMRHRFNPRFEFTATWMYSTGFAYNLPLEKYSISLPDLIGINAAPIIDFGTKNQNRMPDYHRLDLNLNMYFSTNRAKHKLNFGVNNAYDRQNPLYYQLRREYILKEDEIQETSKFVQVLLLPIVPSASYSIEF